MERAGTYMSLLMALITDSAFAYGQRLEAIRAGKAVPSVT